MSRTLTIVLLAGVVVLGMIGSAHADKALQQCLKDARTEYQTCNAVCKDNLNADVALCHQNHPCDKVCADNRHACRKPILDDLHDALEACNDTLKAAVKACRQNNSDPVLRDACIDAAQIAALICRDDAREHAQPLLDQCKEDFKACVLHCHP